MGDGVTGRSFLGDRTAQIILVTYVDFHNHDPQSQIEPQIMSNNHDQM